MTIIDRYILREWLNILGLILCAMIGLLFIQALYDSFRDLLDLGAGFAEIMLYYAVALPGYFSIVLPISLLLSLLYVLSKLHRNNEITAIRAAGLNIFATTRSLWVACLFFCGVSLVLNARVVPWSVETSRQLFERFKLQAAQRATKTDTATKRALVMDTVGLVTGIAFDNQHSGRMWFINRYSRIKETAYGVTVSELDTQHREKTRLMAREAKYDPAHGWTFTDGRETWFDVETGDIMRSVTFAEKNVLHFKDDPALMMLIDRNPRDLSFNELGRIVDYFSAEENPKVSRYAVRYYGLLADTLGPLIILAIAIPFSVAGVRVSPAIGVSKSIGLFFFYYVLNNLAVLLGGRGYIDPLWAACIPGLALIGLATYFFGRLR